MNAAAGNFLAGEEPIDVVNALWDAEGFIYPRNAFKRFNGVDAGVTRSLGIREIGGIFRYVRRNEPPFFTGTAQFLVADSQFVFRDSSITDSLKAFRKRPIGTRRGSVSNTSGSALVVGSGCRFLENAIPKDPFLGGVIDSATYFQIGSRSRIAVKYVISNDTLILSDNGDSTGTSMTEYFLHPSLDIGSQKFFAASANRVIFSDSTKPPWLWDGDLSKVSYVVDSGRIYANTTTILRDNSKAWFPNQWQGYWVRFSQRIVQDRGAGAPGTDSVVRSPWTPIISNDDTSLTLKYDPIYGNAGATYFIMAMPVERFSAEQTIGSISTPNDSALVSSTTGYSFDERDAAITSYPLSLLMITGAGTGQLKQVDAVYKDSIFFKELWATGVLSTGQKFVLIMNTPIVARFAAVHIDRVWYVDQTHPSRIYYSEPLEPGNVAPFNYVDVMPRDGDQITCIVSYNDQLLVYKNNSIARIVGDNPSNFVALPFLENLGTPGINTRTSFAGDEYFYDKNSGIYVIREFNPVRISDPIKPLLDSIPSAAAKNAAMAHFKDHLWFSYPAGNGQVKNNRLITYNTRIQDPTWARHTFNRVANFAVWPQAGDSSRLTVGDPDSGLVYYYDDTARVDAYQTNRIKLTYKTGWLSLSQPELRKQFRGFQLAFDADTISGQAVDTDTMLIYKDQSATAFDTLLITREGQLNNYVTKDINRNGLGRFFQLEMRIAPRSLFKLYAARYKFANVGEKQ